jgi:hypothetical protein
MYPMAGIRTCVQLLAFFLATPGMVSAGETTVADVDGQPAAAERSEQLALRSPEDAEAAAGLAKAFDVRLSLGDLDRALTDGELFVERFGRTRPEVAAEVVFRMGEILEQRQQPDRLARHLDSYLAHWGQHGGVNRQIVARFKLGELLWKRSCPLPGVAGTCADLDPSFEERLRQRARDQPRIRRTLDGAMHLVPRPTVQCGPLKSPALVLVERDPRLARQAQDHFREAIRLYGTGQGAARAKSEPEDEGAWQARFAAAGSAFYQAEPIYERLLRIRFPSGMDFQRPDRFTRRQDRAAMGRRYEESMKRFTAYFSEKKGLVDELAGDRKSHYGLVMAYQVASWQLAALARIGQVSAGFATQLYTAEVPKGLQEQDEWGNRPREIFCDALVDKAEPIEEKVAMAYEICLETGARSLSWNEWSALCEIELHRIDPTRYHVQAEILPEPIPPSAPGTPPTVVTACAACD